MPKRDGAAGTLPSGIAGERDGRLRRKPLRKNSNADILIPPERGTALPSEHRGG